MDADRFDALTRSLTAAAPSRRRLLTGLVGSGLATLAAVLGVAETSARRCRKRQKTCRRTRQCCGRKTGLVVCQKINNCAGNYPLQCCGLAGATCSVACDCCGDLTCPNGTCG
jgi:hypothetical protein